MLDCANRPGQLQQQATQQKVHLATWLLHGYSMAEASPVPGTGSLSCELNASDK
jgi:hypothetical protein